MDNLINNLKKAPLIGPLCNWAEARPRLAAWIVLSMGIVILLLIEARDVGLLLGQWLALIVASIIVAGLCIWIVSWEDSDEEKAPAPPAPATPPAPTAPSAPDDQKPTPAQ